MENKMTESPKYNLVKKLNNIEIRHYSAYIKAEVVVSGKNYKSAIENGFSVLAGFIFGNNVSKQKVEMTTPVQAVTSQKIAMTTPVTVFDSGQFTVAFTMPSKFTLESLPTPNDDQISFVAMPEHEMAVIRFSGYFNQESINQHKKQLNQWLQKQDMETEGDFIIAGHNPPWVPGIFARNEVLVKLKKKETEADHSELSLLECDHISRINQSNGIDFFLSCYHEINIIVMD
jgi:effector-binding domain-containing protein